MERSGAGFLLHELHPDKLIGSAVPIVDASGDGWIQIVFLQAPGNFELSYETTPITLLASRRVAHALVSVLEVTIAQLEFLRESRPAQSLSPNDVSVEVRRDDVVCRWAKTEGAMKIALVEGQIEMRLSETL